MLFYRLSHSFCCLLVIACFAVPNQIWAQHTITGAVTTQSGQPIPYATLILLQLPDSSVVTTAIADSLGNYRIDARSASNLLLRTESSRFLSASKLMTTGLARDTINFQLKERIVLLNDVVVNTRKPLIERKIDRVVFNVENSIAAVGSDALEVIGKAPGVQINGNDEITLAGKSTVRIMLDGKLLELDADELAETLRSIPSGNLEKIEVITTPPARYDAAGNSGIVNIVTKKQKKEGLNGTIGCSVSRNSLWSVQPTATFNYRKNKWNVFGNSNGGTSYSKPTEQLTTHYIGSEDRQVTNTVNHYNYHRSQLGVDYNISPQAVLGILYTYGGSKPQKEDNIQGNWQNQQAGLDSIVSTKAQTHDFGERNVANINYQWKVDSTGKKLNIDADFFTRAGRTVRDFATTGKLPDGTPTPQSGTDKSTGKQVLYISALKADMELPAAFAKLSFGTKGSFTHIISNNTLQYLTPLGFATDSTGTNKFDYLENTFAGYLSANKTVGQHWEFQAGLRSEYTQTRAESESTNSTTERKYFQLFPTAYAQYKPNDDHVFNLNYSRRIERPSMTMLNPFRSYMTRVAYSTGNPFLQPSYTSNIEFTYTLKSVYTFTLYTQFNRQVATQVSVVDTGTQGIHFNYANIGKSMNTGFNASANLQPTNWWECTFQIIAFHATVDANYYGDGRTTHFEKNALVVENEHNFTLNYKKTLLASLGFDYNSRYVDNYDDHRANANINCGVKVLLFKKNLVAALFLNDIFRTEKILITNLYNGTLTNDYYDERSIHLNLNYKFGNRNIKGTRDRTGAGVDENKRS